MINPIYRYVSEAEFQANVIAHAKAHGWRHYHTYNSKRSPRGYPDLTLVKPPRLIFAELKKESGTLKDAQVEWFNDLSACPGVEVYLWRPHDIDEIIKILQGERVYEPQPIVRPLPRTRTRRATSRQVAKRATPTRSRHTVIRYSRRAN